MLQISGFEFCQVFIQVSRANKTKGLLA